MPDFTSQFISTIQLDSKPLKGLRVGLIRETLDNGVDIGVKSAVQGAASHLEELGCTLSEVCRIFATYLVFKFTHSFWNHPLTFLLSIITIAGVIAFLLPWFACLLHSSFI